MYSTPQGTATAKEEIIRDYLNPLVDNWDLLSFRDEKGNNVIHLALKTFNTEGGSRSFLKEKVY